MLVKIRPCQSEGLPTLAPSPFVSPPAASSLLEVMTMLLPDVPWHWSAPETCTLMLGSSLMITPGRTVSVNPEFTVMLLRTQNTSAVTVAPEPGVPQLVLAEMLLVICTTTA